MPVVVVPTCFIDPAQTTPGYTECQVFNRVLPAILQELFQRYPALYTRFQRAESGVPERNWFSLYRERDGEDLHFLPGEQVDDEDRIHLINLIGC